MTQTRYVCGECKKQWVFARGWSHGDNCPICGSQQVELVSYTPAYAGADYVPDETPAKREPLTADSSVIQAPPMVLEVAQ
jgi:DNA-directed RNA polymerase subunit RPC12/RpoP